MKRYFFIFLMVVPLIVINISRIFAEGGGYNGYSVSLINGDRNSSFYFLLDPVGLYGSNPYSPWFYERVLAFFDGKFDGETVAPNREFRVIQPGKSVMLENLTRGVHLVVGFFYIPNVSLYPIKVTAIRAWDGEGFEKRYVIKREPVVINARAGEGILRDFTPMASSIGESIPPRWLSVRSVVSFSLGFKPLAYLKGSLLSGVGSNPREESIDSAKYWNYDGTALRLVKACIDYTSRRIGFYISARNNFSENVSIFLYVYEKGERLNNYTVEIKPLFRTKNGMILLWERGKEKPRYIGMVNTNGNYLEGSVKFSSLPVNIDSIGNDVYFELDTCYFDYTRNLYEEYILATIKAGDIEVIK